jgi:hypothetical protein
MHTAGLQPNRETQPTRRSSTNAILIRSIAFVAAFALVTFLIVTKTHAAFTATTQNGGNAFSTGTVTLTDDDAGSAMFNATNMKPLDTVVQCITVTYSGSITPAAVRLYAGVGGTGADAYLDLTVEDGTGGSFGSCNGFSASSTLFSGTLNGFAAAHTNWANGLADWSPATTPSSHTLRFTATLQDNNAAQNLTATAVFTWEAQNT